MTEPSLLRMTRWASEVTLSDVPDTVREHAKNQILSTLGSLHAGYSSDLGPLLRAAFPPPTRGDAKILPDGASAPPAHAAFLSAAWSMVLDFDDSMLGGHTGHSSVLVPLAFGQAGRHTGSDVLLAQIVANELAARVNTAVALGPLRGQMATHVHLIAAAAARAKLEGLDAQSFAEAVGFALTYPAKALYPGFLGSDAKTVCASWPIRQGVEAVDAVRAGLRGNADILDGRRGFLAAFADAPVPEFLGGLGQRWHTATNSFKVHPGCAYVDAVVDATLEIVRRYDVRADDVASVDVHASIFTLGMDAHSAPYLRGPASLVSTLSFSTPYNVACAVRDRVLEPRHLTRPVIGDPAVWDLAAKVRLHHDEALTEQALLADIPIGAALKRAGKAALRYAKRSGGSGRGGRRAPRDVASAARLARAISAADASGTPLDLSASEKAIGARVELRTNDGRLFEHEVRVPVGAAGWGDWRAVRALMRAKLVAAAAGVVGAGRAESAADAVEAIEDAASLDELVAANVRRGARRPSPRRGTPPGGRRAGTAG